MKKLDIVASMGALHIKFEETRLAEVRDKVGKGIIGHSGDGGESIYWLCYSIVRAPNSERMWIISDSEMGGPEQAVTRISAQTVRLSKAAEDCPPLPSQLQQIFLDGGIWLGTSSKSLHAFLGGDSLTDGVWGRWSYEGKLEGKDCEGSGFDRFSTLSITTTHGRISILHATQVTSC